MLNICAVLAIAILIAFSAFNLFLPYGLIAIDAIIPLGLACGVSAGQEAGSASWVSVSNENIPGL